METILSTGKFALLLHQEKGPDHYDLILEGNELCPTFQFDQKELSNGRRIQDHRKKYLNFEGLISPEKGTVSVIDKGKYHFSNNLLKINSANNETSFTLNAENILNIKI